MEMTGISKKIHLLRKSRNVTVDMIAERLGINQSSAYDLESCDDEFVIALSMDQIFCLCFLLDTSPKQLLEGFVETSQAKLKAISIKEFLGQIASAVSEKMLFCENSDGLGADNDDWYVDNLMSEAGLLESCFGQIYYVCGILKDIDLLDSINLWYSERKSHYCH